MNNKVNLNLMSETKIDISDNQLSFLFDKFQKISYLESKFDNQKLNISPNALVISLLEREGVDSSIIEGTQTNHEEMYYDLSYGIRDKYSWEVRNLINLYKNTFRDIKEGIIDYSIDDLKIMHYDLFRREVEGFENSYDPIEIIRNIKPGKILKDDSKPNWIGPKGQGIDNASLILIKPSEKIKYLNDLFKEVRSKRCKKDIKILIKFHPFFEAVHPFADGNGRLGRLLLVNLFSYLGFSKFNWIFISDIWRKNKDEYIKQLKKVQTTSNWNDWVYFFVGSLKEAVDNSYKKLNNILDLYIQYKSQIKAGHEETILRYFFQYPILNRVKSIKNLMKKYNIPQSTAYRSFLNVVKIIKAEESENNNYRFQNIIDIISQ